MIDINNLDKEFYRTGEVARMLGIPPYTLLRWARSLPGLHLVPFGKGNQSRIPAADVKKLARLAKKTRSHGLMSPQELSKKIEVPTHTLRLWERRIPSFRPVRSPKGRRLYSEKNARMAERIKELVWEKGLGLNAVAEILERSAEAKARTARCKSKAQAIAMLEEVRDAVCDSYAAEKLDSVIKFIDDGKFDK